MGARRATVPVTGELFSYRMSAGEFGEKLIRTKDLDPVYVMLYRWNRSDSQLAYWLLAYWFFYHSGVASSLSTCLNGKEFYDAAKGMANGGAPRGTERRHFRGQACLDCIDWFSKRYPEPLKLSIQLWNARTFKRVKRLVSCWPMFGPWIAFKIADMMERVCGAPIRFEPEDVMDFYEEPREAARVVGAMNGIDNELEVVSYLQRRFQRLSAPPGDDRPVGIQEIETVLCKWKAHIHGNYPVGKDTKEVRHHLTEVRSSVGDHLAELLP